jgi:hypothetical protein
MTFRELFRRFGATIVLLVVIALMFWAMPGGGGGDGDGEAGLGAVQAGAASPDSSSPLAGEDGSGAPGAVEATDQGGAGGARANSGSAAGAAPGGSTGAAAAAPPPPPGAECRPEDGRQPGISLAMPPCVPVFTGDNGGATAQGVTADEIVVVRYVPQADAAVNAALTVAGADDSPEKVEDMYDTWRRYGNHHFETYGREVVFVDVNASGPPDNDAAMRADAIKIAEEVGAFAAIQRSGSTVLADELAQRDVHAIGYGTASRSFYETIPPRVWSQQPTPESSYEHAAEYIGKRLAGREARWAGDDQDATLQQRFREQPRKFGLVWIEGVGSRVDPFAKRSRDHFVGELAKYGVKLAAEASYTFDLPRQQQQSTNIISKMRAAGVSNLVFYGDPLYPAFLTREATRQSYFPEWLITGSLLVDTTFFGRTYDQAQWQHAFGFSTFWVFWEHVAASEGFHEYHHMNPDAQPGDEGVAINNLRWDVQHLFIGLHMAGPELTPDSFARGMLDYPATGGVPGLPLLDYTERDPSAFKDMVEVYWDAEQTGLDETDQQGVGLLIKVDGGRRFQVGQWPTTEPTVFDRTGTIYTADEPPGGRVVFPHDADGHTHAPDGCRSCG